MRDSGYAEEHAGLQPRAQLRPSVRIQLVPIEDALRSHRCDLIPLEIEQSEPSARETLSVSDLLIRLYRVNTPPA
jgi:hypothetical protein